MTGIEWTDTTWNPVTGCDRISAGCDNCYALLMVGFERSFANGGLRVRWSIRGCRGTLVSDHL